ncbi:ring canal kelch protein-like [Cylas formicarius]|uniref:ring canal kelch protein-like n=1 Tax=Cylas formicarius TaxID=197179 RepID=UPI002958B65C|nr:ring canal kelch protein-like [Cylas formicarius]
MVYDHIAIRYANCDENSNAESANGYDFNQPSTSFADQENLYEQICCDPDANSRQELPENIYETIEEVRRQQEMLRQANGGYPPDVSEPIYDPNLPSCSTSTYGRIGNTYGRIDIIGHGIGRIERHLSSSCGSINNNHYTIESLYGTSDHTGRISKVSVQWLLANKWLPLWIANTETGRDYRIIDFLIAQGLEKGDGNDDTEHAHDAESEPPPPPT